MLAPRFSWTPLTCAAFGLLTGCFDPTSVDTTDTDTDTDTPTTSVGDTDGACTPNATEACICADGASGERTCAADGSGFGGCECDGSDTTMGPGSDPTTGPAECDSPADCEGMGDGVCEVVACTDGMCVVDYDAAGTPCGDATDDECNDPDTCDGAGECVANDAPDGATCSGCPLGVCACAAGACGDCSAFAMTNGFATDRSIAGWDLTGGWGLYRGAPQNFISGGPLFEDQVFGTDGNRTAPYPGNDNESSTATTTPFPLPPTLEFSSWNVDEGGGGGAPDTKLIEASTDGGVTWQPLADCATNPAIPFCQAREQTRDPADWDDISIPVPPPLQGQVGIIRFSYNTFDSCCNFERGWFIDDLNFATECACSDDAVCGAYDSDCGTGVCGAGGSCELTGEAAGTACGDGVDLECNAADACDGVGYCLENEAPTGLTACSDCPAGAGGCNVCQDGMCPTCTSQPSQNDFATSTSSIAGWLIEDLSGTGSDMRIYSSAPLSENGTVPSVPLSFAPSFGTDGTNAQPYGDNVSEIEHSRVTTPPDVVPPNITFQSWNVDEGGGMYDNKIIEISTDGGVTWTELANCAVDNTPVFCTQVNGPRAGNSWNFISLPTGPANGLIGQLRITYNTGDDCCAGEQGWFIDNLNFAQYCNDPQFPLPPL